MFLQEGKMCLKRIKKCTAGTKGIKDAPKAIFLV